MAIQDVTPNLGIAPNLYICFLFLLVVEFFRVGFVSEPMGITGFFSKGHGNDQLQKESNMFIIFWIIIWGL